MIFRCLVIKANEYEAGEKNNKTGRIHNVPSKTHP